MATTIRLPFARFVAQVNTATAEPKTNYQALATRNALALQSCEWREAAKSSKATLVTHNFTITHSGDQYDAYLMTGDYNAESNTEVAYAGMAAYRFTLPNDYLSGAQTLVSMSLPIVRDRFLLPGVRVVAVLSDSDKPSNSWSVVHGDASPSASETEYLKNTANRLTASIDAAGSLSLDLAGADTTTKKTYLWIYLTVEDYTATWTMYSKTEPRLYAIEGSAMIVGEDATVIFSADVTPDSGISYGELNLYTGEYTKWIDLPDDTMDSAFDAGECALTGTSGGSARFVAICGENVTASMPSIPGWSLYDVQNSRFISFSGMQILKQENGGASGEDVTSDIAAFFERVGGVKQVEVYCSPGESKIYVKIRLTPARRVPGLYGDWGMYYAGFRFYYYPGTGTIEFFGQTNVVGISHASGLFYFTDLISRKHGLDARTLNSVISVTESGEILFEVPGAGDAVDTGVITNDTGIDWVSMFEKAPEWQDGSWVFRDCCIVGTFTEFMGVECNGLAIVSIPTSIADSVTVKAAYPLPLVFDTRKNLTFHGTHDGGTLFVSGDFKTINGVKANGCAAIASCPASWLLDPSDTGYEAPDWRKVIKPLTCGKIEKPADYSNLGYTVDWWVADITSTSRVVCLRRTSI